MKRSRCIELCMVLMVAVSLPVHGAFTQSAPTFIRVEGLTYDSLTKKPLPDAFVSIAGVGRTATSDVRGRFRIDSVPEGTHVINMQHAAFDSLGLSGVTLRVQVRKDMPRIVLAVPSFATMWRAACGDVPVPKDSALVYGTVRDVSSTEPARNATVDLSWVDLVGKGKSLDELGQRRWRRTTNTDAHGEYALCGVPPFTALDLRVGDSVAHAAIEIEPTLARVIRRDFSLAGAQSATLPVGTVVGTVTNTGGIPQAYALVAIDTLPEVRTGEDGRFVVNDVPIGTRTISILAIGMHPYSSTLTLRAGDTARVAVPLTGVQVLSAVDVRARANTVAGVRELTYEEHKKLGLGDFRDSTVLKSHSSLQTTLREITSIEVRGTPGNFSATTRSCGGGFRVYVDGLPAPFEFLRSIDPKTLAAMEVYKRRLMFPSDTPGSAGCAILLWTKLGLDK